MNAGCTWHSTIYSAYGVMILRSQGTRGDQDRWRNLAAHLHRIYGDQVLKDKVEKRPT